MHKTFDFGRVTIAALASIILSLALLPDVSYASLLTFETTPSGATPTDNVELTTPYLIPEGSVRFYFDLNGNDAFDPAIDELPLFEKAGTDGSDGFTSKYTGFNDTARPGYTAQLGNYFLRKQTDHFGSVAGPFIAEYTTTSVITELSGEIWDIDAVPGGGTEQWRVDVLDHAHQVLATQLSPLGDDNSVASLDSLPWMFSFSNLPLGVQKVRLTFVGTKTTGIGLAFNNFSPTAAVPEPNALLLFGIGIVGVGMARRRRQVTLRGD